MEWISDIPATKEAHYVDRHFPLWPHAESAFTFGVVITMANGYVLPMQTVDGETAAEPAVVALKGTTRGFAEISLAWRWESKDVAKKFGVFRNAGGTTETPDIFVKNVTFNYDRAEYDDVLAFPLWPPAAQEYLFGVVVTMENDLVLPMVTCVQRTAPEPRVDYFTATTLSPTAISLSFGWSGEPAAGFTLLRNSGAKRQAPAIGVAMVDWVPEQADYLDHIVADLGPKGLCSLSDGVEYSFGVAVTIGLGRIVPLYHRSSNSYRNR